MISFFTVPKPFKGHIGIIQENAIKSWLQLNPKPNIFLLGNEIGTAEIAHKYKLHHIKAIECNENSIPLLNDIFQKMQGVQKNNILCYINTDIILFDDFNVAIKKITSKFNKYLMISSRWNLEITQPLDFLNKDKDKLNTLRGDALSKNDMYPAAGSDFFVFPKNSILTDIPPFCLGRGYWDNWLMYQAKKEGAYVIDVTPDVVALHQIHDYKHVLSPNTENEMGIEAVCHTQQGKYNLKIAGGYKYIYCAYDADFVLSNNKICSSWRVQYIYRRLKAWLRRLIWIMKDIKNVKSTL